MNRSHHLASRVLLLSLLALSGVTSGSICGCASSGTEHHQSNSGANVETIYGSWTLAAFADGTTPSESGRGVYMTITPGQLGGSGGVNRFSATLDNAALTAGRFEAGEIVSTKMAGPEAAMRDEARFFEMLEKATRWQIEADMGLVLMDDNAVLAAFWQRAGSRPSQ